jgi:hypothetical protein
MAFLHWGGLQHGENTGVKSSFRFSHLDNRFVLLAGGGETVIIFGPITLPMLQLQHCFIE